LLYSFAQRGQPTSEQRTKVLGFNYRLNNNVSMRMENHWHSGYAMPAVVQGSNFNTGTAKLDWNMFAMGVNFIF